MSNRIKSLLPESMQEELKDPANAAEFQKGQDFLRSLLQRSTTDEGFRSQLLVEPRQAITEYYTALHGTGVGAPAIDVRFIENSGDMTLVLPPFVGTDAELSDAELETVAGGTTPVAGVIAATAVSNLACLGFAAGVGTVILVAWALSD
jgi:hypothetical protein